jgi:serine/threonine protein kinase
VSSTVPTTTGYSAPEVSQQPPDARADVFSLGAVLYTMLAGYHWTASGEPQARVGRIAADPEIKDILLSGCVQPGRTLWIRRRLRHGARPDLDRIWLAEGGSGDIV